MALVKCIICGAVFDDDAFVCPVCGQGPAFWTPEGQRAPQDTAQSTDMRYVILGAGAAGLHAAAAIRERDSGGSITLIDAETCLPYHRPMLTKGFDADNADLPVYPETWYAENGVERMGGVRIAGIDPAAKTVTLDSGETVAYDRCIYALGAVSFMPAFPGAGLPEVIGIRSLEDIRRVRALLDQSARKAVVIGGGVLGLEAAWTLKTLGCDVTVIEAAPRIMARQLDAEASRMLAVRAAADGIAIIAGKTTAAILGDAHVTGVSLADGGMIPADFVIVSAGVRANTALAQAAGAAVDRGVLVDNQMKTSLPDLYACGDCAQVEGPNYQLWPAAAEMGRIAGTNAAGGNAVYAPGAYGVTFDGMHTVVYAQGDVGIDAQATYTIDRIHDGADGIVETCYYRDGCLCGVILMGDISKAGSYARDLTAPKS